MTHRLAPFVLLAGLLCASRSSAEVVDSSAVGLRIHNEATVHATPAAVYAALVNHIGDWWNPEHSFSGDAHNLSLEAKPNGCFCEKLPGGGGVRHQTVIYVAPGKELRLSGAIGPLQPEGIAATMTWRLTPADGGTKLELIYSLGGYFPGGLSRMAGPVDGVLLQQLTRLKSYVETGTPQPR